MFTPTTHSAQMNKVIDNLVASATPSTLSSNDAYKQFYASYIQTLSTSIPQLSDLSALDASVGTTSASSAGASSGTTTVETVFVYLFFVVLAVLLGMIVYFGLKRTVSRNKAAQKSLTSGEQAKLDMECATLNGTFF